MEEIVNVKVNDKIKKVLFPQYENSDTVNIVVSSVNFGQYKECRRSSIIIKEVRVGVFQQFRDMDKYDDLELLASVKVSPFEKTIENFHKLELYDGIKLSEAVSKVNNPPDVINESKQKS